MKAAPPIIESKTSSTHYGHRTKMLISKLDLSEKTTVGLKVKQALYQVQSMAILQVSHINPRTLKNWN